MWTIAFLAPELTCLDRSSCQGSRFLLVVEVECRSSFGNGQTNGRNEDSPMPDIPRPTTFAGKLALVQRLARSAQFRTDPKLAVRELCEAMNELAAALLEREPASEGTGADKKER